MEHEKISVEYVKSSKLKGNYIIISGNFVTEK